MLDKTAAIKKRFVRELQQKATPAENRMRRMLSEHRVKYVFQKSFPIKWFEHKKGKKPARRFDGQFYIADFYLPHSATVIEIDGDIHATLNGNIRDSKRTKEILDNVKMVQFLLRFHNNDVFLHPDKVIRAILSLKSIRMTKGLTTEMKYQYKQHNREIMRLNEIMNLVNTDPDIKYHQRSVLLKKTATSNSTIENQSQ